MKIEITIEQANLLNAIKNSRMPTTTIAKSFLFDTKAATCTLANNYFATLLNSKVSKIKTDIEVLKAKRAINIITIFKIRYIEIIANKIVKVIK